MKTPFLYALLGLIAFTSCDSDDSSDAPPVQANVFKISSDKGSLIKLTYADGTVVEEESTFVTGWNTGSLLNLNYFKQMRFGTPAGSADIRINIPKDTVFAEIVPRGFSFSPQLFLLQFSSDMQDVYSECYFGLSNEIQGGSTGSVQFERNYTFQDSVYSMVGKIEAEFNNNGSPVLMEGTFWSKEFDW